MVSNYQATADTWTSNQDFNTSNLDNFLSSTDNTFRVTGVQLEIGSGSTDFEHLPHDVNLRRCMRYYTRYDASEGYTRYASGFINSSTAAVAIMQLPVPMRGVPSIDHSGTAGDYSIYHGTTTTPCNTTPQLQVPSTGMIMPQVLVTIRCIKWINRWSGLYIFRDKRKYK